LALWHFGALPRWHLGTLVLWHVGTLALFGTVALWCFVLHSHRPSAAPSGIAYDSILRNAGIRSMRNEGGHPDPSSGEGEKFDPQEVLGPYGWT